MNVNQFMWGVLSTGKMLDFNLTIFKGVVGGVLYVKSKKNKFFSIKINFFPLK